MQTPLVIFIWLIFSAGTLAALMESKTYTAKYDNVNIDDILKNERLLKGYVDCLLEIKPCTPDGLELRKNMPDAIKTDCSKCTEKQKEGSETMIKFLIDNKPELWAPLQEKYDPTGSYKKNYLETKVEVEVKPVKA